VPQQSSHSTARVRKIFLGGLSPDTTKEDAEEAINQIIAKFSKHSGYATVTINKEKDTDKPRGFGFATISCEPEDEGTSCDIVDDILKGQSYVKIDVSCTWNSYMYIVNVHVACAPNSACVWGTVTCVYMYVCTKLYLI